MSHEGTSPVYLKNYEAVVHAFGWWPGFHDANVRAFGPSTRPDSLELLLHWWVMTNAVDEKGFYILEKHHLVRLGFEGITDAELDQFTPENILFELGLSSPEEFAAEGKFRVVLDSAIGSEFCGAFSAREGAVLEVVPCDAKGNRIA
ncbi:MAG: hypothetical protein JWO08_4045 [Verrucomicrobiaceae bacterium]|nr:hypothetical protein [Verrucomicrobiaceae bacterium]